MYMVMELKTGGDLRFLLMNQPGNRLPESWAKFIIAQISLGLMYLHSKHVVHRDIKPDNTYWREEKPLHATAGSLVYMAPEILEKKPSGYTYTVDWWSLGAMLFEMVCGKRPFRAKKNDDLKRLIMTAPVEFPETAEVSPKCMDIVKGFLTRPACDRLGAKESGGDTRITAHPWYSEYNWDKMLRLEVVSPYVPDVSVNEYRMGL
ncbi:hypothetical protein HDU98_010690 [Podochytrium sp. JEL0797]|nr:hypothetical protein HDU98_010690 [Podochytrium sp. JEL0797]